MSRVTDGLYTEEGEIDRWTIKRANNEASAELRFIRKAPYPGTVRVTLFAEGDRVGQSRLGMNLNANHVEEIISDLQDILPRLKGEA